MKHVITLFFCLFSFTAWAQQPYQFRQMQNVKVVIAADTLKLPWVGGLNSPIYSTIHLNGDNIPDLYAFDRNSNKSFTFLAYNNAGTWQWQYAPEYEALFPAMSFWVLLRDYDNDGRKDIFTGTTGNILMYRNITSAGGNLAFAPVRALKFSINNPAFTDNFAPGAYVLPSISDLDNDGDLDILVFDSDYAQYIEYYKNTSKETFNHLDSLRFTRVTQIWGSLNRGCGFCHDYAFQGNSCKVSGINHGGGASILALDLDNDTDKDILVGIDLCTNLGRLTNQGTTATALMTSSSLSTSFPPNTTAAAFPNFPTAYYEDVTFDGKKDLLVSPFMLDNLDKANMSNSSWLYSNTAVSATAAPVFTFQKNNFLQDQMIDVGESAAPVFVDIDADGDLDLLVSNYADYRTGSSFKSTISLFTNVGTATKPIFSLTNPDFLNFSAADNNDGYKGIKLQFGDIDGNGSKDMLIKYLHSSGQATYLSYILNTAQAGQPMSFNRANLLGIAIGIESTDSPFFYDMDGDGDLDLLFGTQAQDPGHPNAGALLYHRRVGQDPALFSSWQLMYNDNVGNIPIDFTRKFVNPVIADLNNDNIPELLTTDSKGDIRIYPEILNKLTGTATAQSSISFNPLTGAYIPTALGNLTNFSSRVNLNLAVADLDGDNKPEIVAGTTTGGLIYLKNQSVLGTGDELAQDIVALQIYPNPASETVTISSAEKINVMVFDATGKQVGIDAPDFQKEHTLPVSGLKPGVYFLKIATLDFRSAGRTLVIK